MLIPIGSGVKPTLVLLVMLYIYRFLKSFKLGGLKVLEYRCFTCLKNRCLLVFFSPPFFGSKLTSPSIRSTLTNSNSSLASGSVCKVVYNFKNSLAVSFGANTLFLTLSSV